MSDQHRNDWCLIESDPGVFCELIKNMGVRGVQVDEIYSVDDLQNYAPGDVFGLVFLFNYSHVQREARRSASHRQTAGSENSAEVPEDLFFAHQIITNACATQAILSVLLNSPSLCSGGVSDELSLGPTLSNFLDFTRTLPAEMRGMALSNFVEIRQVHNSFARSDIFFIDSSDHSDTSGGKKSKDDLFHFVAFVPFSSGKQGNGSDTGYGIWELDGLKESPTFHGMAESHTSPDKNWLKVAGPVIARKMDEFMARGEIRFNLMAVTKDVRVEYRKMLQSPALDPTIRSEIEDKIRFEDIKWERYKKENIRRRHNFIPLIFKLLELQAEKNS